MSGTAARSTATPPTPAFQHDLNSCVGCHACAIACINEHALPPARFWRQIVTFNPERRPALPTYHLSLGCNHCLDAPCERACPAKAIARDPRTGAVLIDDGACIGCRYCSWVCPYDAPTFDDDAGIMRKCTLCAHRLAEGRAPACVSQCPTGALELTTYDPDARHGIAGFPSYPVRPAITFVPLRRRGPVAPASGDVHSATPDEADVIAGSTDQPPAKTSLRHEWPLAVFTYLVVAMVAWQWAAAMGGPVVHPVPLVAMAVVAIVVSTAHLGRPGRAWRAARNWRRSWLSREVIALPAFVASALAASVAARVAGVSPALTPATAPLFPPALANGGAAFAGLVLLACVDRVYVSMATRRLGLDRVAAFDSAAFLAGVLIGAPWLAIPTGALKAAAAWTRPFRTATGNRSAQLRRTAARIVIGLCAPAVLWLAGGDTAWVAALAFLGEALDRADFYDRLTLVTPASEMRQALERFVGGGVDASLSPRV